MTAVLALLTLVGSLRAASPPACSTIVTTPRRLELVDGRIVSVDFRAFARSGTSVLAVGRHAYLFPASAEPRTPPQAVDSIIGVTLDASRAISVVQNPALPGRAYHPRVVAVAGASNAWHVTWVTGLDSVSHVPAPDEQVSLWYARYERGAFSPRQQIGVFSGARINPELSSTLLERDGELALAFPFTSNPDDGGVILLRNGGGSWRTDTLRTSYAPHAVRLIQAPRGFVAIVALAESSRLAHHEALYVAAFDTAWSRPRLLAEDVAHRATTLELVPFGDGFLASWNTMKLFDASTSRLHWMELDATGRPRTAGLVDSGEGTFPYAMTAVGGRRALWLYRGDSSGTTIALSMLADSTVTLLPPITAPFRNPVAEPVAVSPTRFLVFTQKLALSDREPMAASYVTEVEMRCPDRGRR